MAIIYLGEKGETSLINKKESVVESKINVPGDEGSAEDGCGGTAAWRSGGSVGSSIEKKIYNFGRHGGRGSLSEVVY